MSQTAYGLQQTPLPGVIADNSPVQDEVSFANTDATWNIPFGVGVSRNGTDENGCKMPSGGGDEFLGVVVLEHTHDPGPFGTLVQTGTVGTAPGPGLKNGATLSVLRKGRIVVLVEAGVTVGAAAFVRITQNGAGKLQLGAFRADADGGNAIAVNGRFLSAIRVVPSQAVFPGQSAGASQTAVNTAILEIDATEVV